MLVSAANVEISIRSEGGQDLRSHASHLTPTACSRRGEVSSRSIHHRRPQLRVQTRVKSEKLESCEVTLRLASGIFLRAPSRSTTGRSPLSVFHGHGCTCRAHSEPGSGV